MSNANNLCFALRRKQLLNIPLARFTPVSPYSNALTGNPTGLTQFDLDMRRKAEILTYPSNKMSTQTNSQTKKEKWGQIVRGNVRQRNTKVIDCSGSGPILTPTTSSGVPGPIMYLYNDANIPLYNYVVTRTYATEIPNKNAFWNTTAMTNVGLYSGRGETLFSMDINSNIDQPQYTYSLSIPVGLRVEGRTVSSAIFDTSFTLSIVSAKLDILCNGNNVLTTQQVLPNTSMTIRVVDSSSTASVPFVATQFVNTLVFSDIPLYVSQVYEFAFVLTLTLAITGITSTEIRQKFGNSLLYYGYGNMTTLTPIETNQCILVQNLPGGVSLTAPTFTGV